MQKFTYYSGSLTKPKAHNTSCNTGLGIKLLPSGSNDLKTRRAISLGVSFDTKRFSSLKSTVCRKGKERKKHANQNVQNVFLCKIGLKCFEQKKKNPLTS